MTKKKEISLCEIYAREVVAGKIVAGRYIQLAAKRFLSDLKRTDIYFDIEEANKVVNFAERYCCLWEDKWEGEPVKIMPWMAFILQQIYGWHFTKTKLRRFRKVYVQVAKKNAKSTLAGVIANFHLFADTRIRTPKVFVGANNEDQAKICVNIAGNIIKSSPALYDLVAKKKVELFTYKENIVNIFHKKRNGFMKALAKETESKTSKQAGGKHGLNPSLWIIDEYGMADSATLLETLQTAQASREEPLGFTITTAGYKINGPCYSQLRRTGVDVLEGITENDTYLPIIFEMDKGDEIYDPKTWIKSNPNLGVSVFHEFLKDQVKNAKEEGGSTEVNVRTLNFNEWCETPEVWIPRDLWLMNSHKKRIQDLEGMECFGGLQLLGPKELNAFTFIFPYAWKNLHAVRTLFWMPAKAVIENHMKMDFGRWVNEEWIVTCPGNAIDNDFIFDALMGEISGYKMDSLSFPVYMERSDIVQSLIKEEIICNPISNGYKGNSEPTFEWERLITKHQIEHFQNPVLAWSNSQTMAIRRGDDVKVERAGGKTAGIVACINALAQWKTVEAEPEKEFGIDFINLS